MKKFYGALMTVFLFFNCSSNHFTFESVWNNNPELGKVAKDTTAYKLQVLLTDLQTHKEYSYNVNSNAYYYPASTVKLPAAIVALEKIHQEARFSSTDSIQFEGDSTKTTIRHEIEKIFAISDNDAFNKLLWITGNEAINYCMKLAEGKTTIRHSLQPESDFVPSYYTVFSSRGENKYPTLPIIPSKNSDHIKSIYLKGKHHYTNEGLIKEPMDFSQKNEYDLKAFHTTLNRLYETKGVVEDGLRFRFNSQDEIFLKETMAKFPNQLGFPPEEFPDNYVKFLVIGDKEVQQKKDYKLYNKVGFAYGQVTDGAYIVHNKTGKAYILSATLYVNENEILNDDSYEYESIAIPFLAKLGRAILQELEKE